MFKKASLLALSFLLAFYPAAVLAAETEEQQSDEQIDTQVEVTTENNTETDTQEDSATTESVEEEDNLPDSESKELPEEATNSTDESTTDEESTQQEEQGKNVEVTNEDDTNDVNEEIVEEDVEPADVKEEATSEDDTKKEESDNEEDNENTPSEQLDEDLDLTNVYGTIKQRETIQYDFNKGYYVLNIQAGLGNYSRDQVLNDKWIAFALPNGVYLADQDVPAGIVPVNVKGKNGIAIKIPDVKEFPDSKYVNLTIPLVGEPNDNDPVNNLYLYNVNVGEQTYEEIGQIKSQRDIDFSPMEGTPELDIDSDFTGKATYDSDKGYYVLDLTVNATNHTNSDVSDIYGAFTLPEGVQIVDTGDSLDGVELLDMDDESPAVAVKLPELGPKENKEITYQIPLLGKTTENVASSTIHAYIINGQFLEVGQLNGSVHIDLSEMGETWDFSAESQIVKDFPGLEEGQIGLRFGFTTQNLTWNSIDRVKVEFQVPDTITIYEPELYEQGEIPDSLKDFLKFDQTTNVDLDLTWDGNTAIIDLDTVEGVHTYQGWFTAFGETNVSLNDLEGLEVLVTLFQNGEEVAKELHVPFEIVSYDGKDDPDEGKQNPSKKPENPNPGNDNDDNNGDKDKDSSPNDQNQNEETPSNEDNNQSGDNQNDNNEEKPSSPSVDNNNHSNTNSNYGVESSKGTELPNTATNMYSLLLIGGLLTVAGSILLFIRKRKALN